MSYKFVLNKYTKSPELYPESVIDYDSEFVLIKDSFPKSLYHWLLLPRDPQLAKQHPLRSFGDPNFKEKAQLWIDRAIKDIVELFEIEHGITVDETFIRVGCHAVPSLSNLHIHIISQDFSSQRLKHKVHYNSFTTQFFVPFESLPLTSDDTRMNEQEMEQVTKATELVCLHCGKHFKNKFADLKRHLHDEFKRKLINDS